ncbi:MAG: isoleucine--tRNA ligase [Bacteroidales bacterium]|nr:isoleucine--tRNA ligase [Bacteroidales bacterium]
MTFKEYKELDLVGCGEDILRSWKKTDAFRRSLELREGAPEFIFFEGPPSANGMPGIHHVMARSIKDAVCRYKTMTGFKVRRRAGWDTHGLPVELGVEKKLGITKEDIGSKISVADYNRTCREEVMKYTAEWRTLTERIGYWVDMDDPYVTYDNRYIETLWYLLKDIYKKGYLYKGKSIQPYSPAAGTGLSSHELNQPGCYRDVKDTTCCAQFEVVGEDNLYFLAWTTTPWTLPSNTALCVGPNIDYVKVRSANPYTGREATYILAEALVGSWFSDKVPYEVLPGRFKGRELEGMRYRQLIPWFRPDDGAFKVILGDYVTTEDGTGVVHIAPTFGADDAKVAKAAGVPGLYVRDSRGDLQAQVDPRGRFYRISDLDAAYVAERVSPEYEQWQGRYVKNAYDDSLPADAPTLDVDICVMLKAAGKAFRIEKHTHTYPHCWRTDKPVLYYPLNSWFIRATSVRDKMMELNSSIVWKPESTGTGRFGQWLENIQDWNLSRSRYWGTPLPIWRTEDGREEVCIGSVRELYDALEGSVKAGLMASNPLKDKGFDPGDMSVENYSKIDLHRPCVDDMILVSSDGRPMRREADLIDVWFDSGAMPYAQTGLRGKDTPDFGATADFIAEGVDQTRGWFYTLHAIHTMVSGTPAFRRVISNGLVLDRNGEKMSKRLGNAVDPFKALDTYGADSLRWYMLTNAQPWDNLKFDGDGVDETRRKFFGTLYNTYSFFALYANVDGFDPSAQEVKVAERPEIDRWIISVKESLVEAVRNAYEDYDVTLAGRLIQEFVCDHVSNWYVRLGRKRFWGGGLSKDKLSAYQTLWDVLRTVALLSAPLAPFFSDRLWRDLTGRADDGSSVHFESMPVADKSLIDRDLEEKMALAQKACSMVLALRRKVNIKVRQPLSKLVIPVLGDDVKEKLEAVKNIILSEVNVKEAEFIFDTKGLITKKIKPNFRTLGKKYGTAMKSIAAAFAALGQDEIAAIESAGTYTLDAGGIKVGLEREDYEISSEDMPGWLVASEGRMTIALDIEVTDELRGEGLARELVNRIQNVRKDSGLEVTDRIEAGIYVSAGVLDEVRGAVGAHRDYLCSQTLSLAMEVCPLEAAPAGASDVEWDDGQMKIKVIRKQ